MTNHAQRSVFLPLAALLLLAALAIQVRTAHGDPTPLVYRDADSCAQLAPAGVTWNEYRIDNPATGAYSSGYVTVELSVYRVDSGSVFDWQANLPIDAIYAAGGPGGNLYQYNPPGPSSTGDEALHAPYNGSGRNYHSLEVVLFCASSPLHPTPTATPLPTATQTPTPLPSATLAPPETPVPPAQNHNKYLPLAFHSWRNGEEPNDQCGQAYRIRPNNTYQFLPDDPHDWFTFELAEPANLTVTLVDFSAMAGQIAAYQGSDCASSQFLGNNGDTTQTKELALGLQPAGRYFLYVSNDGVLSTTGPYSLTVNAQP